MKITEAFSKAADAVAEAAGHPASFVSCCLLIIVWGIAGPFCGFSDTWQLVINTGTTIITFLMVFLIQNTQNRENAGIQAKLDELVRVAEARNDFIAVEKLSEDEVLKLRKALIALGETARETPLAAG